MVYYKGWLEQRLEAGTWKQEVKHKPWMNAACGPAPLDLVSLLYYTTQGHLLRNAMTTEGWTFPHESLIQKIPHRLPTGQCGWGIFSIEIASSQITLA